MPTGFLSLTFSPSLLGLQVQSSGSDQPQFVDNQPGLPSFALHLSFSMLNYIYFVSTEPLFVQIFSAVVDTLDSLTAVN